MQSSKVETHRIPRSWVIIISGALGQNGIILSKILVKKKFSVYGFINEERKNKIETVIYKKINFLYFNSIYDYFRLLK